MVRGGRAQRRRATWRAVGLPRSNVVTCAALVRDATGTCASMAACTDEEGQEVRRNEQRAARVTLVAAPAAMPTACIATVHSAPAVTACEPVRRLRPRVSAQRRGAAGGAVTIPVTGRAGGAQRWWSRTRTGTVSWPCRRVAAVVARQVAAVLAQQEFCIPGGGGDMNCTVQQYRKWEGVAGVVFTYQTSGRAAGAVTVPSRCCSQRGRLERGSLRKMLVTCARRGGG